MISPEPETVSWLRFAFASSVVLALLALFALALKWFAARGGFFLTTSNAKQGQRLSVVSSLPLDGRRRLVLVRCDEREYLLLLGPSHDLLLDDSPLPKPPS
ncbi:MAG: flagellar biosynthetic protein FliO [Alphaproteobacteria bacterium]|nr:flagellar biosynthetic protein FliO [Alphaproteobacteria bacterium]